MLRLNRKKGESIVIELDNGELVEIQIIDSTPSQVQVGVVAPRGIAVWRRELYQTVLENRVAASQNVSAQALADQLKNCTSD